MAANRLRAEDAVSSRSGISTRTLSVTIPTTDITPEQKISPEFSYTGLFPPSTSPTASQSKEYIQERMIAVSYIERIWFSYRDRQMFRLLKHAVCAAEHSLSYEILRKVSPKEAAFLKDKFIQTKVRFRFGGSEFPPLIYFKIFMCSTSVGIGLTYMSGKKMILPASEAARDACDLMGARKFYDQVIEDTLQNETHSISDEIDVTTLKDYMQYLSLLDELPSYMGGKSNNWRELTLEVLPRQTIFYDVLDYVYSSNMSQRLKRELPALLIPPLTQDVQRQHIRIISEFRAMPLLHPQRPHTFSSLKSYSSSRRSKEAQRRVSMMRQMYEKAKGISEEGSDAHYEQQIKKYTENMKVLEDEERVEQEERDAKQRRQERLEELNYVEDEAEADLNEDIDMLAAGYDALMPRDKDALWDVEASQLYEWSQHLPSDEDVDSTTHTTDSRKHLNVW